MPFEKLQNRHADQFWKSIVRRGMIFSVSTFGTRPYRDLWKHRDSFQQGEADIPETGGKAARRQRGRLRRKTRGTSPRGTSPRGRSEGLR